jgi:hypothetical protein
MSGIVAENSGRSSGLVKAGGVSAGSIETAHLANDAVTAAKCANDFINGFPGQDVAIADSILYQDSSASNETRLTTMNTVVETIMDTRSAHTGSWRVGAAVTADDGEFNMGYFSNGGSNFFCTLADDATLNFTYEAAGQWGWIWLVNSGGRTVSLDSDIEADSSCASTLSTSGTYVIEYYARTTTNIVFVYTADIS